MGNGVAKKDKQNSHLLQTLEEHEGSVNCMALSDDCSVLATGSDDATIRIWSTKTDQVECIGILEGHSDYVTCLLIEENFILSSSADKTIKKWELASCECLLTFKGHESTINKIICTGDYIFSVSYDKRARMWDFDTGECIKAFRGHKLNITSLLFIPCDSDNFVKKNLNSLANSKLPPLNGMRRDNTEINSVYSKDIIVTGSLDATAKSWSIESGDCLHTFKGHTGPITCMATDPSGKLLFTGSADHEIRSWDMANGQFIKAHKKLLFSASADHTVKCWVMEFGECTRTYKDHGHSVSCVIEKEGLIYTGCGDCVARCFDVKSGSLKRSFKGHTGAVNCLRMVDNRLYTGSFDGTLKVWDTSGLCAEKSGSQYNKSLSQPNSSSSTSSSARSTKMSIENEKSLSNSRSSPNFSNNQYDFRSEVNSRFDDNDYKPQQPTRRIDVREIV